MIWNPDYAMEQIELLENRMNDGDVVDDDLLVYGRKPTTMATIPSSIKWMSKKVQEVREAMTNFNSNLVEITKNRALEWSDEYFTKIQQNTKRFVNSGMNYLNVHSSSSLACRIMVKNHVNALWAFFKRQVGH